MARPLSPITRHPSWQSRALNLALRLVVRRRLERIERIDQRTAEASRKRLDGLRRWQRLPAGTSVEAVAPGEGAPGEWIAAPGADPRRTVFYLHGGAYTIGSPAIYRELCARLSAACGARVFAAAYRLAPEHPCPAAIDDAEVAWRWLLAHGVEPRACAVAGDSAGGGLALALLARLRDAGQRLPACAALLAPWTDLGATGASVRANAASDPYIVARLLLPVAAMYRGALDVDDPRVSPLFADLRDLPPMLVQASDSEVLRSDAERLVERALAAGVAARLQLWPAQAHVFQLFARGLPEGRRACAAVGEFVRASTVL